MRLELAPHPNLEGVTAVVLGGELDQAGAPALRKALDEAIAAQARVLLMDLSEATFIDSAMLGVVVYAARRVDPLGGRLVVLCPDPGLRQLFEMVGLDRVFPVLAEPAVAARALAGAAPTPRPGRRR